MATKSEIEKKIAALDPTPCEDCKVVYGPPVRNINGIQPCELHARAPDLLTEVEALRRENDLLHRQPFTLENAIMREALEAVIAGAEYSPYADDWVINEESLEAAKAALGVGRADLPAGATPHTPTENSVEGDF